MSTSRSDAGPWKWCALAAVAMIVLSMTPQIYFWFHRGSQWQGAYTMLQGDEILYSAYVNALIDGRPRRNDPFTGQDDTGASPLPESTFSIQVVPSYAIYALARGFGLTASTAFVALPAITSLFTTCAIFWLLLRVTEDARLAAMGVLLVLCLGGMAGGHGILGVIFKSNEPFLGLPFLRRYQPSVTLPLFFLFGLSTWLALTVGNIRRARILALLGGGTLGLLFFSYFYLATTAVAWFLCITFVWLYFRPSGDRRRTFEVVLLTVGVMTLLAAPYTYLVSNRASGLDEALTLTSTRFPDPFRIPEIIGALVIISLVIAVRRGRLRQTDPRVLFAASLALVSFVVFNQQVLSGKSMQAYHYEVFVTNYAVLIAVVIAISLLWQRISRRSLILLGIICLFYAALELHLPTKARNRTAEVHDEMVPVLTRLKALAHEDGTFTELRAHGNTRTLVFSPQIDVMRWLPTWAPQGTLLGIGGGDFSGLSRAQRRYLLHTHLHYSGRDSAYLRELLNNRIDESFMNYFAASVLFGHERVLPFLGGNSKTISAADIETEVTLYQNFQDTFSIAGMPDRLGYLITRAEAATDLSRLDRLYQRDSGERIGKYWLYRLKRRP